MIPQKIKEVSLFGAKYLAIGVLFTMGVGIALLGAYAFQTMSPSTPSATGTLDTNNSSLNAPMLTKSGGTFDRNNMSLEAIANALGLTSVGSAKRIFLTSITYQGNLGGVTGADTLCQGRATARSLGGTWKALISGSTSNVKDRLNIAYTTTTNLRGEVIAFNPLKTGLFGLWKAKTNASQYEIKWPLIQDDLGAYVSNKAFWSNSDKDGSYINPNFVWGASACSNWTSSIQGTTNAVSWGYVGYFGTPGSPGYGFDGASFFNTTSAYNAGYGSQNIPANTNSNATANSSQLVANGYSPITSYPTYIGHRSCDEYWPLLCQEQ